MHTGTGLYVVVHGTGGMLLLASLLRGDKFRNGCLWYWVVLVTGVLVGGIIKHDIGAGLVHVVVVGVVVATADGD